MVHWILGRNTFIMNHLRPGQTLFNTLLDIDPEFAESIRGVYGLDPFYKDEIIPDTLKAWRDHLAKPFKSSIIEVLHRWSPHSGSCCISDRNGKVTITEESCRCDDVAKRARKLAGLEPYGPVSDDVGSFPCV